MDDDRTDFNHVTFNPGPNEISIADVSAVRSVFAVDGTRKGPRSSSGN